MSLKCVKRNHNDVKRYYKYATDTTVRPSDLETKPPQIKNLHTFKPIVKYQYILVWLETHLGVQYRTLDNIYTAGCGA